MFLSRSEHTLDAKNRVSVPAPFRALTGGDPHPGLYLFPHLTRPCLEGGGLALIESYRSKLARLGPLSDDRRTLELLILGQARRLDFDANGRITLPAEFIDYAGLSERVVFVGCGDRFELWNAAAAGAAVSDARGRVASNPDILNLLAGDV